MIFKCCSCPREDAEVKQRFRLVENAGCLGGWLLELINLCDSCALIREDLL